MLSGILGLHLYVMSTVTYGLKVAEKSRVNRPR